MPLLIYFTHLVGTPFPKESFGVQFTILLCSLRPYLFIFFCKKGVIDQ